MENDLYNILGVSQDASENDIKKAYKKLCREYHPDRFAGKSEQEQHAAEEKFKEINKAYQILGDPDKRRNYDQFGTEDGPGDMFGNGFNSFGGFNPFERFFGGNSYRNASKPVERGKDIQMKVSISIEELFTGVTKKLKYNRPVRCINCHGVGGTGVKVCKHCGGTGMVTKRRSMGMNSWSIINTPCTHCGGTGQIIENKCPTCHGEGLIKESATIELKIPAGIIHSDVIRYAGGGADSKDRKGTTGDLLAVIQYDFIDDDKYDLTVEDGKVNVTEHIMIPYYDLLLGYTHTAMIPNGESKNIDIPIGTRDGKKFNVYKGEVNYNIIIHYLYPGHVPDYVRDLLLDIKNIYEN